MNHKERRAGRWPRGQGGVLCGGGDQRFTCWGGLGNSAQPEVIISKQIINDDRLAQKEGRVGWETLRQSGLLSKQQSDHPGEGIGVAKFPLWIKKPISFPRQKHREHRSAALPLLGLVWIFHRAFPATLLHTNRLTWHSQNFRTFEEFGSYCMHTQQVRSCFDAEWLQENLSPKELNLPELFTWGNYWQRRTIK